jgi:hypothetical protein
VLRTSVFTWVLMRKKKPVISNTGRFFCFNSTVSYTYLHDIIGIEANQSIYYKLYNCVYI